MTGKFGRLRPIFGCILAAPLILSACAGDLAYQSPKFPFLKSYAGARSGEPVLLDNAAWWRSFNDPTLNTLVDRALHDNLSIALAKERVIEARANAGSIPGEAEITPRARVERRGFDDRSDRTEAEAAIGLSWMLDPFGARRRQVDAARARIDVADAEVNAARLLLLFNLSNAYLDLRFNQRALELRHRQLRSRRQAMDLTRRLVEEGAATKLDQVRTEALVAETQSQIPMLMSAAQRSKYQIAVLIGVTPGKMNINLDGGGPQPRAKMSPDVGIPADLLRNRPDIRIAERLYYAAVAETGVARANLYPQLSLGGTISLTSISGNSGTQYRFGPAVTFPSLLNDDSKAAVSAAESRARQAFTTWQATVLEAIQDVETALAEYSGNLGSVQAAQRTAQLYGDATGLTRDLILSNGATILDLVDAEQSVASADIALAQTLRDLARSYVAVSVNLGSGNGFGSETPNQTTH